MEPLGSAPMAAPGTGPPSTVPAGKSKNRKEKPFLGSGNPLTSPATATASAVHTDTNRTDLPMDITPPPDPLLSGPLAPDTSGSSLPSAQPTVTLPLGSTAIAMGSGPQVVPSFGLSSIYVTPPHNAPLPGPPTGTSGNSFPSAQMTVAPPSGSTATAMGSGPHMVPSFGPSSIYVTPPHNAPLPGPPTGTSGNFFPFPQMTVAPPSGSTAIAMGSGPHMVPSFGPSSIYVTPPNNALLLGPPTGTSGNFFPSTQMTVAPPSGSTAIAMGSGPHMVPSFGLSSIYVIPPNNALLLGPPTGTNVYGTTQGQHSHRHVLCSPDRD
ncbi:mucin-2-like [Cavia porcellus]|uniref:mucin-2-like n=1 Tax=Cavia porcellus TaxID=10141 RepID=UPI002FE1D0B2